MPKTMPNTQLTKAYSPLVDSDTLDNRIRAIRRQIQKDYGVTVVGKQRRAPNPYKMSTDEAVVILKKAGILTKSGKLSPLYK